MTVTVSREQILALPRNNLGKGENAVIAYAFAQQGCITGRDDRQARMFAETLGLRVLGIVGVLVKARQRGVIESLPGILQQLQAQGFHLSEELRQEALRL